VQLRPDAGTGAEGEKANRFATTAQGHHKQPGTSVLAGLGIPHHGAAAVIDLGFLTGSGDDHDAGFRCLRAAQLAHEALYALVVVGEAVLRDQILPDGSGIATSAESQLDGIPVRFAETGRPNLGGSLWFRSAQLHAKPGDHPVLVGRF